MNPADFNDIAIEPTPCAHEGCPLLGVGGDSYGREAMRCCFHTSGKLNAFDQHARPGMTVRGMMTAYIARRRAVVNLAWLRRATSSSFEIALVQGKNDVLLVARWLVNGERAEIGTSLLSTLALCELRLQQLLSAARETIEQHRAAAS